MSKKRTLVIKGYARVVDIQHPILIKFHPWRSIVEDQKSPGHPVRRASLVIDMGHTLGPVTYQTQKKGKRK